MKVLQIANEYKGLIQIFAAEGMISFTRGSDSTATLKSRMVGRVTDNGMDWKLKVFYPGMNLVVSGQEKVYLELYRGVPTANKISLTKFIAGIRDPELRAEAEYKHSVIKVHARSIQTVYTTPSVMATKISDTKAKFAAYVQEAKEKLKATNADPMV